MPFSATRIYKYAQKVKQLNEQTLFRVVFNNEVIKEEIIYLNTEKQLFDKGQDARGIPLDEIGGDYSPYTVELKRLKGQPTDRVTLKDTGAFYNSFTVTVRPFLILISADTQKDDNDLAQDWGQDILGLSNESIERLKPLVIEHYTRYIRGLLPVN